MTNEGRDVRVEASVASARATVTGHAVVARFDQLAPLAPVNAVRTHVRRVLSIGGSSISSVSPPPFGQGRGQEGAVTATTAPSNLFSKAA